MGVQEASSTGTILVCTLGGSWAVVPEVYGFLAPQALDLYRKRSGADLTAARRRHGLAPPAEIWVATSGGETASATVSTLEAWWGSLGAPVPLRVWQADGTDTLAGTDECDRVRELIFRLCLHAAHRSSAAGPIASLAGGRKTMSADLQRAAGVFGCAALIHVVGRDNLPGELQHAMPDTFLGPLPENLADAVTPVVLGCTEPAEIVALKDEDGRRLDPDRFPLPGLDARGVGFCRVRWKPAPGELSLAADVERRERAQPTMVARHFEELLRQEAHGNWLGLFRLPARQIACLRGTRLQPRHEDWLIALPKAELHLHLGGFLDVAAQREVGRAVWEALTQNRRRAARDSVRALLRARRWPDDWAQRLRTGDRPAAAAALLVELPESELVDRLFSPTGTRVALKSRHRLGFRAYELPGELSGSALLAHEAAVGEYARQAYAALRRWGTRYCEVRGSPGKYLGGDGLRFLRLFAAAVNKAARDDPGCTVRFVMTADRRADSKRRRESVALAVQGWRELGGFVVGLDLAGDEGEGAGAAAADLEADFRPAFEACLPLTIHAGEGEPPDHIWAAAYRLHAQRLGHALSLGARPDLADRLRDRGIPVELCPTSNVEVVGYRDPGIPATADFAPYPFTRLWRELKLPVTVCTDNPGISRTTPADEFLRLARMDGNLTLWETLALVRAGFTKAFAPAEERSRLLRDADTAILNSLTTPNGRLS